MYLASQLAEISSRFPAHVEDLRQFLLKEKLPVPSPEAIPELANRLARDARFRADVGSLLRATLYREREKVGYEDLLGMLVVAAAGTTQDLKADSQDTDIREMLRFVLQSRRATFHGDPDEASAPVEVEAQEAVQGRPVQAEPEPLLVREPQPAAHSRKLELKAEEPRVPAAEAESRESGDLALPAFRTTGLFAAQAEVEVPWWRVHPAWIAGVICMLVGVGLGLSLHRVVSAAEAHVAVRAASPSIKPKMVAPAQDAATSAVPKPTGITEAPVGTVQTAPAPNDAQAVAQPQAPLEGRSTPPPVAAGRPSAVPVTVVKQVVTASAASGDATGATQLTAATRSTVHPGAGGMTAANVIFSPAPEYPPAAAAARVHGQVTVHAVVDPEGNVIYARAVSGPQALRDAAKEAVQRWRYSPLLDNGKPIAVTTVAILDFKVAK